MARRVQDREVITAQRDCQAVPEGVIDPTIGVYDVPQHPVVRVQPDRGVDRVGQLHRRVDVVVVAVGAQDPANPPTPDGINDRSMVMGGIDHHHLVVVADQPDVVVYLEVLAVQ